MNILERTMDLSFEIADRIEEFAKKNRIKKKDFADYAGVNPSEVTKWVSGTHNFTLSTIAKIEKVLGCVIFNFEDLTNKCDIRDLLSHDTHKIKISRDVLRIKNHSGRHKGVLETRKFLSSNRRVARKYGSECQEISIQTGFFENKLNYAEGS